jgi:hypothetical protein
MSNVASSPKFRIVGTTDEVTSCDCCGKTELKSTVELWELDADGNDLGDQPVYFGVTCAARAMRREVKEVRRDVRTADQVREAAARAAKYAAEKAREDAWRYWLNQHSPITTWGDTHTQIGHAARAHGIDFVEGAPGVPQLGEEFFRVWHALRALAGLTEV